MNLLFEDILIDLLKREGGFVNDPADRGGATNFGVTIGTLKRHNIDMDGDGDVDIDDVKLLDFATVKKLYREQYWEPAKVERLPGEYWPIYFDMVVNHGQANAVRILQRAANSTGEYLLVDGIIGPKTINAVRGVPISRIVAERVLFFAAIVHSDKTQRRFWFGWFNRSLEFLES